MADMEKVTNGLKTCIGMTALRGCAGCPYNDLTEENCQGALMADALELLKGQEAVEPRRINGKRNHFIKCGNCNYDLLTGYLFCPRCGKAVKWDE